MNGARSLESVDAALAWLGQRGARGLRIDSRQVAAGEAFIAWPGHAVDARQFVPQALERGALACLVEAQGLDAFGGWVSDDRVATLTDLKACTGPLASAYFGSPSERLRVVAITGTNGKTSTAWWLAQVSNAVGRRCALVGTLGVGEVPGSRAGTPLLSTGMTTPDPVTLHSALRQFADDGVVACAVEATSIGLVEHRLDGCRIDTAVFTNFTQDHLDFHGTMSAYWQAKERLFKWPGLRAAVINVDDAQGRPLVAALSGHGLDIWTTSTSGEARLWATDLCHEPAGLSFELCEGAQRLRVRTPLLGTYNIDNLLGVLGALRAGGAPLADLAAACTALTPVPGRLQRVQGTDADPVIVVDYAHTPDALDKALRALQPLARQRGGELWCVFGCGGNRDAVKRPLMGAVAQRLAQRVVLTSDNPRHENPGFILLQIVAGLPEGQAGVTVIEDRRKAIFHAARVARDGDVILLAGKGHEDYQDVAGVKRPFSDTEVAAAALQARRGAAA